jgi:Cytochrome c554 and c-prime
MVKEDHGVKQGSERPRQWIAGRHAAAVLLLVFTGLLWYGIGCGPQFGGGPADKSPSRLFHDWPNRKPVFVMLLSGQQYGYLQPCGCSPIQYGGLERRYNLIQRLKAERAWPTAGAPLVAVDLGDIPQPRGPQKLLKYVTSMEVLKRLDYTAVGIGENECALPLIEGLANFALNNQINNVQQPPHVLAGNLSQRANQFPGAEAVAFREAGNGVPKIGVASVVAPSVAQTIKDPTVKFNNNALPGLIKELQNNNAEFKVLLCQGTEQEAKQYTAAHPDFQVILHLSLEEEPPENPTMVGNTMLVSVGHKGRYVGLVGVFPGKQPGHPYELYYQLLKIGPEYKTHPGQDATNPILASLEEYAQKVKDDNYLQHYAQTKHPMQIQFPDAKYVGSEACKNCHEFAYMVWKNSKHAHAFHTLETATRPKLRQFDGECVVCHVIGFEYLTGYRNEKDTPQLKDVGCESCHGPGSIHADKKNPNWRKRQLLELMNPYKTPLEETAEQKQQRMLKLHVFCQHCHDTDNDVGWNNPPVKQGDPPRRWHDIKHMNPKD